MKDIAGELRLYEITTTEEDQELLRGFYETLYVSEFPDPDERESLDNIQHYLALKAQGWYGPNNYHVVVLLNEAGRCVAGSIFDYLAGPNAGVIEFLVVDSAQRGRGLGSYIHQATQEIIAADAREQTGMLPVAVFAEINDPCRSGAVQDNMDPSLRSLIWSKWGYRRLDFPYIQPALSAQQQAVRHLLLAIKVVQAQYRWQVPVPVVTQVLYEYMRWAMRIEDPYHAPEYLEMQASLERTNAVPVVPLARVLDPRESGPIAVREITGPDDSDLEAIRPVYQSAFYDPRISVPAEALGEGLATGSPGADFDRHLWAVRAEPRSPVAGMVSFFTFPGAGFGGYVVLGPTLRGKGLLRSLLARVEEQMVRDCRGVRGWFIECEDNSVVDRFRRLGFHEVPVPYRQPALPGREGPGPILQLLYKEIGSQGDPELHIQDLLEALARIFQHVYNLDTPRNSPLFLAVEQAAQGWPDGVVRWSAHEIH